METKKTVYSIYLEKNDRESLQEVADESGQSAAGIIRRLIRLSGLPEVRKLLGLPEERRNLEPAEATQ